MSSFLVDLLCCVASSFDQCKHIATTSETISKRILLLATLCSAINIRQAKREPPYFPLHFGAVACDKSELVSGHSDGPRSLAIVRERSMTRSRSLKAILTTWTACVNRPAIISEIMYPPNHARRCAP